MSDDWQAGLLAIVLTAVMSVGAVLIAVATHADTDVADYAGWVSSKQIAYARGVQDALERGHRETRSTRVGEATAYLAGMQDAAEALSVIVEMGVPAGQRDESTRHISRLGARELARQLAALGEYDMASGIAGIMRRAAE